MQNLRCAGRSYRPRYCSCGAEAFYVVQVSARTLGPGSRANRKVRLGKAAILCGECSRNLNAFVGELESSTLEALDQVRQPQKIQGNPLFDDVGVNHPSIGNR